jgi:hypothetical protein
MLYRGKTCELFTEPSGCSAILFREVTLVYTQYLSYIKCIKSFVTQTKNRKKQANKIKSKHLVSDCIIYKIS